ncbi:MAG TPA: 30S ribosomal protein S11 [Candidatus Cloacimonetes bacterium]|nr:30S ribosomal protein S11 [Candidatus Cloacimonadota bacterium]HEX37901.1 30S ribosomal protein S11 [Candidatus Cloacimonadota bacterium]
MAEKKRQKKVVRKKKVRLQESDGIAHIQATFNNTIITITDMRGNVIAWSSCGKNGFKNSKKSTSYAAQQTAKDIASTVINMGLKNIHVRVSGPGSGRDSAVRSLQGEGLNVLSIVDTTPIPHNGCRPPKRRRI